MSTFNGRHVSRPGTWSHASRACLATMVALSVCARIAGQSPQQAATTPLTFEAASLKPTLSPYDLGVQAARAATANGGVVPPLQLRGSVMANGRFSDPNTNVKSLLLRAYDIKDYQLSGGPSWIETEYFDIEATAGHDATVPELRLMLQSLLAERFGLRSHTETRQAPAYTLSVARADGRLGEGLIPSSAECVKQVEDRANGGGAPPKRPAGAPTTPVCGMFVNVSSASGGTKRLMGGVHISDLISTIATEVSAPVVDRTGLTGLFDITLSFTSARRVPVTLSTADPNGTAATPPVEPPIDAAIQQQLGLKVVKSVDPLPVVVIDSVRRPDAN